MSKKFTSQDFEFAREGVEKTARELLIVMRGRAGFSRWPQYVQSALIRMESDIAYIDQIRNSK